MMLRRVLLLMGISWSLMAGACVEEAPYVVFENPSEQYLNLTGVIEAGMKYTISVTYVQMVQASGCSDYNKKSGICFTKPHFFKYVPQIQGKTHKIHVPLKELSPGPNSWWEPIDLFICVGPASTDSEPLLCQQLFGLSKSEHDVSEVIDLVCSPKKWLCSPKYSERDMKHVSKLNREYVVNIYKETSL